MKPTNTALVRRPIRALFRRLFPVAAATTVLISVAAPRANAQLMATEQGHVDVALEEPDGRSGPRQAFSDQIDALPAPQRDALLTLLNEGTEQDLSSIAGIATVRSAAIREARPFATLLEVLQVRGIGDVTFTNILQHDPSGKLGDERIAVSGS